MTCVLRLQINECKRTLTPAELDCIIGGPKTLDFGTVSVYTTVERCRRRNANPGVTAALLLTNRDRLPLKKLLHGHQRAALFHTCLGRSCGRSRNPATAAASTLLRQLIFHMPSFDTPIDMSVARTPRGLQVIPPSGVAGFDLKFSCPDAGAFRRTITYTVNGCHACKFIATAMVPHT